MTDCEYCDRTFDDKKKLHLHWLDEHEDELNSHQKDEAQESKKEYERQQERKQAKRSQQIKMVAVYGGFGILMLAIIGIMAYQFNLNQSSTTSGSIENLSLNDRRYLGSDNASVTVVKFSDFQCHYCDQFDSQVFPQLKREYIDEGVIKFYHLHYPALGPASETAAIASECVAQQNESAFWTYKKDLFDQRSQLGQDGSKTSFYTDLAADLDTINQEDLASCIDNRETQSIIQEDVNRGNQIGVSGTPYVMVGDQNIDRWDNFQNMRDAIEARQ